MTITGRAKELIITGGGKNISPSSIETRIRENLSQILSQVVVIGDDRKYLSCLLTLKVKIDPTLGTPTDVLEASAKEWCKKALKSNSLSPDTIKIPENISDFLSSKYVNIFMKSLQEGIDSANLKAEFNAARVQKFSVLPNEFSIAGGEYGPTLKLKRFAIANKYKNEIEKMYS